MAKATTSLPTPNIDLKDKLLSDLAEMVRKDWKNVYFGAKPYLAAMQSMDNIDQNYGSDSGREIVNYFLSNATTWRGPTAKMVKAELNRRVKLPRSRA